MNKSQILERQTLVDLISQNVKGKITKACYRFYRGPFIDIFSTIENINEARATELYVQAFSALCIELEENQAKWLNQGMLFDGLVLLGKKLLKAEQSDFDIKSISPKHEYLDSELLLQLIQEEHALATKHIQKVFREPAGRIFCANYNIKITSESPLEDILAPFNEAFVTFHQKICNGTVKLPMTATLFTYFYQFFKRKALEHNRRNTQRQKREVLTDEIEAFHQIEEEGETFFDQLLDRLDNRLVSAKNERDLIKQLMKNSNKICQQLLMGFYFEGKSLAELGKQLNLPSPKKRIHDCRKTLRKYLSN